MARQGGIVQIQGKIGGMVFAKDGTVRQAPPSNQAQFKSAPSMARTRENAGEFSKGATAGKAFRDALRTLTQTVRSAGLVGRVSGLMNNVLKLDGVNNRGERELSVAGLVAKFTGFEFNPGATLASVFYSPFTATRAGAVVTLDIPSITPGLDLRVPQGATHFELTYGAVSLSCDPPYRDIPAVASVVSAPMPIDSGAVTDYAGLELTLPAAPGANEAVIAVLGVKFYQEVNGTFYAINNGSNNPLAVVSVG